MVISMPAKYHTVHGPLITAQQQNDLLQCNPVKEVWLQHHAHELWLYAGQSVLAWARTELGGHHSPVSSALPQGKHHPLAYFSPGLAGV